MNLGRLLSRLAATLAVSVACRCCMQYRVLKLGRCVRLSNNILILMWSTTCHVVHTSTRVEPAQLVQHACRPARSETYAWFLCFFRLYRGFVTKLTLPPGLVQRRYTLVRLCAACSPVVLLSRDGILFDAGVFSRPSSVLLHGGTPDAHCIINDGESPSFIISRPHTDSTSRRFIRHGLDSAISYTPGTRRNRRGHCEHRCGGL